MPARKRRQVTEEECTEDANKETAKEPAKMTVAELRKELQARSLDTTGKKAELVSRLEDAMKGSDEVDSGQPPSAKKAKVESSKLLRALC